MPDSNFNLVGGVNLDCLSCRSSISVVSNSFRAAGHIYIHGFYTGQTLLEKTEAGKTIYLWSPNFLFSDTRN